MKADKQFSAPTPLPASGGFAPATSDSALGSSSYDAAEGSNISTSGGLLLGIAMGIGNALGYVFVLILTRALGPEDFGAYSSLATLGLLLAMPGGALQIIVARRFHDPAERTSALVTALGIGSVFGIGVILAAGPLTTQLHLDSWASPFWMALVLVPSMSLGALQGVLLGSGKLGRLSAVYILNALLRLVGVLLSIYLGAQVWQVFAAITLASLLTTLVAVVLARSALTGLRMRAPGLLSETLRTNMTMAAFLAMTTLDVILVRALLDEHVSGGYSLASTFAKALSWGTQFIALLIVPAGVSLSRRKMLQALSLVVGLGIAATAVVAINPEWFVYLAGGSRFSGYGNLVLAYMGVGILMAAAQFLLFSEMAGDKTFLGVSAWSMVAIQCTLVLIWFHDSPLQILLVWGSGTALVVSVGFVRALSHHSNSPDRQSTVS